jgi:hypothetical protein
MAPAACESATGASHVPDFPVRAFVLERRDLAAITATSGLRSSAEYWGNRAPLGHGRPAVSERAPAARQVTGLFADRDPFFIRGRALVETKVLAGERGYRGLEPRPRPARYVVMSESSWPVSGGNIMARRFASFSM